MMQQVEVDIADSRRNPESFTESEMELSHESKRDKRGKRRRRLFLKTSSGTFLKRLREGLRKPVVNVKNHVRLLLRCWREQYGKPPFNPCKALAKCFGGGAKKR